MDLLFTELLGREEMSLYFLAYGAVFYYPWSGSIPNEMTRFFF